MRRFAPSAIRAGVLNQVSIMKKSISVGVQKWESAKKATTSSLVVGTKSIYNYKGDTLISTTRVANVFFPQSDNLEEVLATAMRWFSSKNFEPVCFANSIELRNLQNIDELIATFQKKGYRTSVT